MRPIIYMIIKYTACNLATRARWDTTRQRGGSAEAIAIDQVKLKNIVRLHAVQQLECMQAGAVVHAQVSLSLQAARAGCASLRVPDML